MGKNGPKDALDHHLKADQIWIEMTNDERHGVKFGLFPYKVMTAAKADGYDEQQLAQQLLICMENHR